MSRGRTARYWVTLGVSLVVSAVFVYLTLSRVNVADLQASFEKVEWRLLLIWPIFRIVSFFWMTVRAQLLLRPLADYSFSRQLRSVLLGFVVNNVLPLRAGEFTRVAYLARHGNVPVSSVLAAVALERLLDAFVLLMLFLFMTPVMVADVAPDSGAWLLAILLTCGVAGVFGASRWPALVALVAQTLSAPLGTRASGWVVHQATRFSQGLAGMRSPVRVAKALGATLGYWGTSLLGLQIWLWAFGFDLPWYAPLVVAAFLGFGTMLPSAPAFVGTYHYFAATSLVLMGVGETDATSFGILAHALATVPFTVLSVPFLLTELTRREPGPNAASPVPEQGSTIGG